MANNLETAIFGGGCFWCTEAVFGELKGVIRELPGYAGGSTGSPQAAPTYEEVCSGKTGHAEVTKVEFDPSQISYEDLLNVFFYTHDPTTLNRQGNDVGTQYRSVIFYANEGQKIAAQKFIDKLNESGPKIVTKLEPLKEFYKAEDYHQKYYEKNASQPYCQLIINPKIEKLKAHFHELLKKQAK